MTKRLLGVVVTGLAIGMLLNPVSAQSHPAATWYPAEWSSSGLLIKARLAHYTIFRLLSARRTCSK